MSRPFLASLLALCAGSLIPCSAAGAAAVTAHQVDQVERAASATAGGFWVATSAGTVGNFGTAAKVGPVSTKPASPVVATAGTPDAQGF
jgi:hypothetical protein